MLESRQILKNCGIDLDSAHNGVCLTTTENSNTKAVKHAGDGLHTKTHSNALATRLRNAMNSEGCKSVEKALDATRREIASGSSTEVLSSVDSLPSI